MDCVVTGHNMLMTLANCTLPSPSSKGCRIIVMAELLNISPPIVFLGTGHLFTNGKHGMGMSLSNARPGKPTTGTRFNISVETFVGSVLLLCLSVFHLCVVLTIERRW